MLMMLMIEGCVVDNRVVDNRVPSPQCQRNCFVRSSYENTKYSGSVAIAGRLGKECPFGAGLLLSLLLLAVEVGRTLRLFGSVILGALLRALGMSCRTDRPMEWLDSIIRLSSSHRPSMVDASRRTFAFSRNRVIRFVSGPLSSSRQAGTNRRRDSIYSCFAVMTSPISSNPTARSPASRPRLMLESKSASISEGDRIGGTNLSVFSNTGTLSATMRSAIGPHPSGRISCGDCCRRR